MQAAPLPVDGDTKGVTEVSDDGNTFYVYTCCA